MNKKISEKLPVKYKRVLAIGDIHGEYEKFLSLYNKINFNPREDLLIFLGDYIDMGEKPLHVLNFLYKLHKYENVITLCGNHEDMMIDYYNSGEEDNFWLINGGDITRSWLKNQTEKTKKICMDFVKTFPLSYKLEINGKKYFFCHGGVRAGVSLKNQKKEDLLWIREEYFENYKGNTIIVSGHTNVYYIEEGRTTPIIRKNMILCDTGSYMPEGYISCVDVLNGKFWQSEEEL